VLAYFDFATLVGPRDVRAELTLLRDVAPALNPRVLDLAFVFILIATAPRPALAPMHTWLAPTRIGSPARAQRMMSAVLLAVAALRDRALAGGGAAAVGHGFADDVIGLLRVLSARRRSSAWSPSATTSGLLAYSSIEHTGLICVGPRARPAGVFAAMLHLLSHSVAKSVCSCWPAACCAATGRRRSTAWPGCCA